MADRHGGLVILAIGDFAGDSSGVRSTKDNRLDMTGLSLSPTDCILIADDIVENTRLLRKVLEHHGYANIHTTTAGRSVVSMFAELNPDIVLLDLHMPGVDGLDADARAPCRE